MTQSAPQVPPPCNLDEEYYWDFVTFSVSAIFVSSNVTDSSPRSTDVQARGHLFRVPKYRLISESEHFSRKYALDRDTGSEPENEYDNVEDPHLSAVKLDDVSAEEFRSFLKVVYPK
jgi:hypothetical protein